MRLDQPVLVLGGGYAGIHAARQLRRHGVAARIVDKTERHSFITRLAAVAGGTQPLGDADARIADLAKVPVTTGEVVAVHDGAVELAGGTVLEAERLIVTTGATPARPPIDGLDHALPLRSSDDARRLRAAIAAHDGVAIIGGGATGCQLAGAVSRAHPRKAVTLIDAKDRLMAGFPAALGHHAERVLRWRGVDIVLGTGVDAIEPDGVHLEGDGVVDGLPVWAGGFRPAVDPLDDERLDEGKLAVDDHLRVRGWERTFAAGDVAAHRDRSGSLRPMSAQLAVQAGRAAADNAARSLRGRSTRPARFSDLGWVIDLGGVGVAELGPVPVGFPLVDLGVPALHWGIDVRNLLQIGGLRAVLSNAPGRGPDLGPVTAPERAASVSGA